MEHGQVKQLALCGLSCVVEAHLRATRTNWRSQDVEQLGAPTRPGRYLFNKLAGELEAACCRDNQSGRVGSVRLS